MKNQNSVSEKSPMQVVYDINLEKIEREKLDIAFQEKKAREESSKLTRISNILLSLWEVAGIIAKLGKGECIIISRDGELFTGKVKTEKYTKLRGKLPGQTSNEFDGKGLQEYIRTKDSVNGDSPAWKNWWDNVKVKLHKQSRGNIMVDVFIEAFENFYEGNNEAEQFLKIHTKDCMRAGYKYTEIKIPDFPIIGGFSIYGEMKYYISDGEIVWVTS